MMRNPFQMHYFIGQPERAALFRELEEGLQAQLKPIGDDFRPGNLYRWHEPLHALHRTSLNPLRVEFSL